MWSTLLGARLIALEWRPAELAHRLTEDGLPTTRQVVEHWLRGSRPEPSKWTKILRTLGITDATRSEWESALRGDPPTAGEPAQPEVKNGP